MLSTYLSFSLFAFIASITPGPSNLISLVIGSRRGVTAALPFISGSSVSMALILWFSGIGFASFLASHPNLKLIMGYGGGLWVSWLAWKIFSVSPRKEDHPDFKPIGWVEGAGLQLVNPKAWMMALSTISIFSLPQADNVTHISWLTLIFFLIAIPCQCSWSWLGQSTKQLKGFSRW